MNAHATTYRPEINPRAVRNVLTCSATDVAVVTAVDDNGKPAVMTIKSLSSVSLDPRRSSGA